MLAVNNFSHHFILDITSLWHICHWHILCSLIAISRAPHFFKMLLDGALGNNNFFLTCLQVVFDAKLCIDISSNACFLLHEQGGISCYM